MTEVLLQMLLWVTVGLALVLLLRRPARHLFGAGPAFTLWLLPMVLMVAPWLPQRLMPTGMIVLPGLKVAPHAVAYAASSTMAIDLPRALVALWLLVVAFGLLRLGWHCTRLLRGMHGTPVTLANELAEVTPSLDLRRVRIHDAGPAVLWALPRALLLLPEDFTNRFGNAATRELVLRHELTHIRRGDAWWTFAMEFASVLLWFHPLAWIARSRFRLDQELACDAHALRSLPPCSAGYARALLDSVAVQPAPALIPWLVEPQLKERIAMISRIPPSTLRRRTGFFAIAALLVGGGVIAGGNAAVHAATPGSSAAPPSVDVTFKQNHQPSYPVEALQRGEQGVVMLDVSVDAEGHVTGIAVDTKATTAPAVLQSAALAAAANWKFNPGDRNGKPAGGVVQIPVTFSLTEDPASAGSQPCGEGYRYQKGTGKSYSCIAVSSAAVSS